jgi:hypothetical protein
MLLKRAHAGSVAAPLISGVDLDAERAAHAVATPKTISLFALSLEA